MQDAGEEEDENLSERRRPSAANEGAVDVAAHEVGHGLVPCCPVCADATDVPPVSVELSIAKLHNLCKGIQRGLEEGEKAAEPAEDGDGRELHDALSNGGEIQGQNFVKRILEQRRGILGGRDPNDNAETCDLGQALEDKVPSNLVGARIDRLVYESWGPPEVAEILHVDVLGVRAGFVEFGQRVSLLWVQICVAEIAVGECVRGALEEDDDGVELA